MFDLDPASGNITNRRKQSLDSYDDRPSAEPASHPLDNAANQALHSKLMSHALTEFERHAENREEMAEDHRFYDNKQWRDEDKAEVEARGQVPLVYNVTATSIDWITGAEKRARMDYKILARRKEGAGAAEQKTKLIKYLADANRTQFHVSRAFEDSTKGGIGWIEDGWRGEQDGDEPLYSRYESWRNMWWDSVAKEMDLSDARYMIRANWFDVDTAQAIFPDRASLIHRSATDIFDAIGTDTIGDRHMDAQEADTFQTVGTFRRRPDVQGYERRRVRLMETWFKRPVRAARLKGGEFSGEFFDKFSEGHVSEIKTRRAALVESTAFRMHVAIMTASGLLYVGLSPYRHNRFPFTPVIAYRDDETGMPYGVIRRIKSLQEDVNKRASKALHILSTNKVIMEEGALGEDMTPDDILEEVSRPDAVIIKKQGAEFTINNERDLSQWHMELMSRNIQLIQSASGVTDENLGRKTNATSGIAIQRRQDQGALSTLRLFDNLAFSQQVRGEKLLANIEQFMDEKKQFRITSNRGAPEYVTVNDDGDENPITRFKADFVISETEYQASVRQSQAMELMENMRTWPPEIALAVLDLVIEATEIPNRDEIVQRIRKLSGQSDPDAEEETPEMVAAEQAQQQAQAQAQAQADALMAKIVAEAARTAAQAKLIQAQTVTENIGAQKTAIEAAAAAASAPHVADLADHVMHEAGFKDRATDEAAQQQAMAAVQQPPQPAPQPMPPEDPSQQEIPNG